jgi:YD repeat-containing protein
MKTTDLSHHRSASGPSRSRWTGPGNALSAVRAVLAVLTVLALATLAAPAHAGRLEMPQGRYLDTTVDLQVKVLGGKVRMRRTWGDGQWHFNRAWNDLRFTHDSLNGEVLSIERNGEVFTRAGGSLRPAYIFGQQKYILSTAADDNSPLVTGYQWHNRRGDWIDYDLQGRMLAYGDRNDVRVSVQRNAQGHIASVHDHHGNAVLRFDYDANGHMTRAEAVDPPDTAATGAPALPRSVTYSYENGLLASVTNPVGALTTFDYDGQDRLTAITDPNGHRTELTYHPGGQVAHLTRPGGLVTDSATTSTRPAGNTSTAARTAGSGPAVPDQDPGRACC